MTMTDENPPPAAPTPAPSSPPGSSGPPDMARLVLPLVLAAVVLVLMVLTPVNSRYLGGGILGWLNVERPGLLHGLFITASVLSLAGVLTCRWARWWGLVLAAIPFVLLPLTGTFVWAWLLALIFVAVIAGVDGWRAAILPWAASLVVGFGYCLTGLPALILGGPVDIRIRRVGSSDLGVPPIDWSLLIGYLGAYLLLITAPVVLAVAAGLIRDARAQRREATASERRAFRVESTASERARLARDLHDVVAHHLSLVAVRAESAPFTHPGLGDDAREVLASIASDARSALDELRQVLKVLRPAPGEQPDRAPQPGAGDIAGLVRQASDSGQRITVNGDGWASIPPAAGYVLYRAVQEALTNARRHAPGKPVELLTVRSDRAITLRASNPLRPGQVVGEDGRGLIGMRERVTALGGTVSTGVTHDVFALTVTVPLGEDDLMPGAVVIPDEPGAADDASGAEMRRGVVLPGELDDAHDVTRAERSLGNVIPDATGDAADSGTLPGTVIPDGPGGAEGAADDGEGGR